MSDKNDFYYKDLKYGNQLCSFFPAPGELTFSIMSKDGVVLVVGLSKNQIYKLRDRINERFPIREDDK